MTDLIALFSLAVLGFFAICTITIICKLGTIEGKAELAEKQNAEIIRQLQAIRVFYAAANPQVEAAIQQGFYKP